MLLQLVRLLVLPLPAGYFGADCSLSIDYTAADAAGSTGSAGDSGSAGAAQRLPVVLLQGRGYELNPRGPKVYVYELPPQYTVW